MPDTVTTVTTEAEEHPAAAVRHNASFLSRLTTGTGAFNILGHRRWYYIVSSTLIVLSLLFILVRGFHLGIDFVGGTRLTFQPPQPAATADVERVFQDSTGVEGTVQTVGTQNTIQISSAQLSANQTVAAKTALTTAFHPAGGVSDAAVSGTWGAEISQRALLAVLIFLVGVGAFIWIRYERRVAVGAVASVIHDLIITAGIYAAVGFEVAPATVIGLLTILGFSLYDTVVVYDKVQENAKGLLSLTRRTYPEAANLAVNQTLMRSINTSLIALLPVAGLLTAGVAILGSGTLKDLSLVLLVGMLVGAYSSVFVAVPLAVTLKTREPAIKTHTAKVLAKRRAEGIVVDADGDPVGRKGGALVGAAATVATLSDTPVRQVDPDTGRPVVSAPKPGAKPVRPGKPTAGAKPITAAKPVAPTKRTATAKPVTPTAPVITTAAPVDAKSAPSVGSLPEVGALPELGSLPPKPPVRAGSTPARTSGKAARPTGKRGR